MNAAWRVGSPGQGGVRRRAGLLLLALLAGCERGTYTRVTTEDGLVSVKLRGEGARVQAAGDELVIHDGQIWVNGTSFGPVRAHQTVRYLVEEGRRDLIVDNVIRRPLAPPDLIPAR